MLDHEVISRKSVCFLNEAFVELLFTATYCIWLFLKNKTDYCLKMYCADYLGFLVEKNHTDNVKFLKTYKKSPCLRVYLGGCLSHSPRSPFKPFGPCSPGSPAAPGSPGDPGGPLGPGGPKS